jgi:NAD(P)-dependent dehydrogenase (short-subunit alcohol dehydrogenase family)
MIGKTVVITGATSGIGEVAAIRLAELGARIICVARDAARADATLARLREAGPGAAHAVHLADLSVIAEMKRVGAAIAAAEPRIDVLINNAGAMFNGGARTADGLGASFATNHLAYYVLALQLLPRLQATAGARIVCTSSHAHRRGRMHFDRLQRNGLAGYAQSKLANLLLVRRLAQFLGPGGVTVNALHPGFVATRFADNCGPGWRTALRCLKAIAGLPPEAGAATLIYLAQAPEVAGRTGGYYVRCEPAEPSPAAQDDAAALRLWQISAQLTGLDFPGGGPRSVAGP